ncbi:MAG: hypothetical protein K8T89_24675 [Planctomycetes bacterium]|nr:hypothetical protein [Planctomycetota bacterium]
MKDHYERWYIRLPDGRVVKAKSTTSVRHHVTSGNIPLNSMARRQTEDEWVSLVWIAEFNDLGSERSEFSKDNAQAPAINGSSADIKLKTGISSRLDPMKLQTVGIRGLVDELIAACDSTINNGKLIYACAASVLGVLAAFLVMRLVLLSGPHGPWLAHLLSGTIGLLALSVLSTLLTRQTHLEISRMRQISLSEAAQGIGPLTLRVFLGFVATIGLAICLLILIQHLPEWISNTTTGISSGIAEVLNTLIWGFGLMFAFGLFVLMLLSLLIPAILVVEECSVGDALREWRALLREHRVRVLVYEGMALAVAVATVFPLALSVQLALRFGPELFGLTHNWIVMVIPLLLQALSIGPGVAFLAVANLFIYLNLRYDYSHGK